MRELVFIAAGLASGIIAGMGMGGGTLLIPALTLIAGVGQRAAQGVNMLAFLPAAAAALWVHKKEGRVELKKSLRIVCYGAVGAALGALAASWLDEALLRKGFGAFLMVLAGIRLLRGRRKGGIDTK